MNLVFMVAVYTAGIINYGHRRIYVHHNFMIAVHAAAIIVFMVAVYTAVTTTLKGKVLRSAP